MRIVVCGLLGAVLLAAAPAALAQNAQPGTAGPHPDRQAMAKQGLFPPNEPVPEYRTGADAGHASLEHPNSSAPNAGNTGLNGSAGTNYGWSGPALKP